MKNKILKIALLFMLLPISSNTAHAMYGMKEYDYQYNKSRYFYVLPTYASYITNVEGVTDGVDGLTAISYGLKLGYMYNFINLEAQILKDNYKDIQHYSTTITNMVIDGYTFQITALAQAQIPLNKNTSLAPYLGAGMSYTRADIDYNNTYSDRYDTYTYHVSDYLSDWGVQLLKVGLKLQHRFLVADVGVDAILSIDTLTRFNYYISFGGRF